MPFNKDNARTLGARGGKIGGLVRKARLSPERRREIALQGVKAREAKKQAKITV